MTTFHQVKWVDVHESVIGYRVIYLTNLSVLKITHVPIK